MSNDTIERWETTLRVADAIEKALEPEGNFIVAAMAALAVDPLRHWQPIEDAPGSKPLLLFSPSQGVAVGDRHGALMLRDEFLFADTSGRVLWLDGVTHWMLLPEPPK